MHCLVYVCLRFLTLLCIQALIVADAYKRSMLVDWVNPLYKKVVVNGDFRYFNEYKTAFPLSSGIFQELANKCIWFLQNVYT